MPNIRDVFIVKRVEKVVILVLVLVILILVVVVLVIVFQLNAVAAAIELFESLRAVPLRPPPYSLTLDSTCRLVSSVPLMRRSNSGNTIFTFWGSPFLT